MTNVLLLRTPKPGDRYDTELHAAGHVSVSVPVLETSFVNLETLASVLKAGSNDFKGVVVTSARAAASWKAVLDDFHFSDASGMLGWSAVPFYVVGKATADALRIIKDEHPTSPHLPNDIRGEESGTGEALARFILNDLSQPTGRLLYLIGDKTRDVLPRILRDAGMELHPTQVYETRGSSSFADDLALTLKQHEGPNWWIVFFAPSAAELVTPIIRKHFELRSLSSPHVSEWPKVAAIGPTTADFLKDKLGLYVDAVAGSPTPAALLQAISQ